MTLSSKFIFILTDFTACSNAQKIQEEGILKKWPKLDSSEKRWNCFPQQTHIYMTPCLSSQLSMNSIWESLITINVENAEQFTDLKINSKTLNLHTYMYVKWVIL